MMMFMHSIHSLDTFNRSRYFCNEPNWMNVWYAGALKNAWSYETTEKKVEKKRHVNLCVPRFFVFHFVFFFKYLFLAKSSYFIAKIEEKRMETLVYSLELGAFFFEWCLLTSGLITKICPKQLCSDFHYKKNYNFQDLNKSTSNVLSNGRFHDEKPFFVWTNKKKQ